MPKLGALRMGVMSGFEKFFVNRAADRNARGILGLIEESCITIASGSSILELGAGKGAVSYLLYQRFAPKRLVVTDYDPLQVAQARSYFAGRLATLPEGVEIRTADALGLPFGDEEFDVVFASHVLHHVERHEWNFKNIPRVLDEVRRTLKVGGFFIYEEIFNKSKIQASLRERGFDLVFEKMNWPSNRFYVCVNGQSRRPQPRGN